MIIETDCHRTGAFYLSPLKFFNKNNKNNKICAMQFAITRNNAKHIQIWLLQYKCVLAYYAHRN